MHATYGFRILFFIAIIAVLQTRTAMATLLDVSIDTSSLSGTSAQLAFDLIDGDGVANNMATITAFSRGGIIASLDPGLTFGDVIGNLPNEVVIKDTVFFNEYIQPINLGNSITFTVDLTVNYAGGFLPDQFSFFILDEFGSSSIVFTDDPLDTHALLAFDITGGDLGNLQLFRPLPTSGVSWSARETVPEPYTIWLIGIGFMVYFSCRLRMVLDGRTFSPLLQYLSGNTYTRRQGRKRISS